MLLAVRDTEVDGTRGCVPWSDVQAMLKRDVRAGLVIMNVDQPAASPRADLGVTKVAVMGALRPYDERTSNASLRAYADVELSALESGPEDLAAYLTDGLLDSAGFARLLAERAPKAAGHASHSTSARTFVLRDFVPEIERASAVPPSLRRPSQPSATTEAAKPSPPAQAGPLLPRRRTPRQLLRRRRAAVDAGAVLGVCAGGRPHRAARRRSRGGAGRRGSTRSRRLRVDSASGARVRSWPRC